MKTIKECLAEKWAELNDLHNPHYARWNADQRSGAMKIIAEFIDHKARMLAWKDYVEEKREVKNAKNNR